MNMLHRILVLAAAVFWTATLAAKDLPNDERILKGQLPNGVKWMYRQHNNPPGKIALMVHVRTGSLNETDEQRGLAHFIEHMAFNGTENFPPGTLVPYFESIGMQFGPHLNAYTSFDQTVYMLFTPNTEVAQIDKAMMVLSDYIFRMKLLPEELNKERGIVLEESRSGKSAQQRIRDKLWPEMFAGSRFAQRLPIGKDEVLAKAPPEEFIRYYEKWYRPENVTVMVVGDAAPGPITPLIEKWFAKETGKGEPEKPFTPEFKPFTEERALVVTDPETAYCQIQMINIRPGRPPTTTTEQARVELIEAIGSWIIGRRYDELVKKGEASFRGAGASAYNFFNDAMLAYGFATGEADDWNKMLRELIVEVKRAREHGFTQRELDLARREMLAEAERAVRTEPTRNAREIIEEMVEAVNDREPILSAQQTFELYKELFPAIKLEEVNGAFASHFAPGTFAYAISMKEKEGAPPSRDQVLSTAKKAWAEKVSAPVVRDTPTNILAELPKGRKFIERTEDKDLNIISGWLENGVRVHYRFMDYKKDTVFISLSLAGGGIEETAANAGVTDVALIAINEAATTRLNSMEMRDLMTGKNISVSAADGEDHVAMTVAGSPLDLEFGLQKAHALLTDGKVEEAAFRNWKLSMLQNIEQQRTMPQFRAYEAMQEVLSGGDPRQMYMKREQVEALSAAAGQEWFNKLRGKPMEVAVVGDIPFEKVMPLIEQYIGSLPERPRKSDSLNSLRRLKPAQGELAKKVTVETMTPQAMVLAGFKGSEAKNIRDSRALQLAANILTSRLIKRVREELAIVYSISASSQPSWVYQDAGRVSSGAPCDPQNADKVVEEVHKVFRDFGEKGPTADELANAKKQIANNLDTSLREPSYWWSVLRNLDLRGRSLEAEKTIREDYEKFSASEIQEVFKKYYTPERIYKISAVPVEPKTSGPAAGGSK
ncbi:MAG TPA: pitrilysin family protein [Methylomirabilota bacterium]|nr:pitrilysin family protein [Methylomirabilota bacterium]